MKRLCALCLILSFLLCFLLTGCGEASVPQANASVPQTTSGVPEPSHMPDGPLNPSLGPNSHKGIWMGNSGAYRIRYTFNQSSVRYITSVDQLPDYQQLEQFDEKFFREKALVLVLETVASGSVSVSVESITLEETTALVHLCHQLPEGIGTGDMTTWMIWVVVDRDLPYDWVVSNPAIGDQTSNY